MTVFLCVGRLQAKRSKGAPKAAKPGDRVLVSILVTDVQDFSDLTRRYPELMNKAMGGHNNIMRKACHAHAGHVMDQEVRMWGSFLPLSHFITPR